MFYTNIEQLTVGTSFYQERTYAGFVEFKVISNFNGEVSVKSISQHGYDFELTQEGINAYNQAGKRLYSTLELANEDSRLQDEARVTEYVVTYGEDKEGFTALILKRAYISAMDAEYGDEVEGKAIKELASIHFPEVEL